MSLSCFAQDLEYRAFRRFLSSKNRSRYSIYPPYSSNDGKWNRSLRFYRKRLNAPNSVKCGVSLPDLPSIPMGGPT